jgi:predicted nucleic acid-binding protein
MRLVFLDTGTLGLLAQQRGKPRADECRRWVAGLLAAGVRVFVPEIADYEVRRKLLHVGATAGIRRLDQIKVTLDYAPITTDVMLRAAELWADLRRSGLPTAAPGSLDGDCILAAQALLAAGPGDVVTVATDNVGHLGRMVDARTWETVSG